MNRHVFVAVATSLVLAGSAATGAQQTAQSGSKTFEISVTNVTPGISFTPLLITTHSSRISLFQPGQPASPELATMAEAGNTAPLKALVVASGESLDAQSTSGLLAPGATVTVRVQANERFDRLSIAGMLLPTNDGFVALNSIELPWDRRAVTMTAIGYDAGSEPNDELCANIPGPHCGGVGPSPDADGEGFVHVHNGVHGFADLNASTYDWRNPIARITIRRIN
jgi:Spondin_N